MALSVAQKTQVYEILGLPQNGAGDIVAGVAGIFGPALESVDFAAVITRVEARLAALSDEQVGRVATLLTRHTAIGSSSPLRVESATSTARGGGGVRGALADHPAEREAIRAALGNLIGVAVPAGGFVGEAQRALRGRGRVSR